MIRDLVVNRLPGLNRKEIIYLLGESPTHDQMRRHTMKDFEVHGRVGSDGYYLPGPRSGKGHYFDELDWDLIYEIGYERIFLFDHTGQALSPDPEYLIIRIDENGRFQSWYIEGSAAWPRVIEDASALDLFSGKRSLR